MLTTLTVIQVAYELFSPLSFDYDKIQRPVLDYFNKNWVRSTSKPSSHSILIMNLDSFSQPVVKDLKALDIVLDKFASGDLPQARELIKKVWTRMAPVSGSEEGVEKNKKKK